MTRVIAGLRPEQRAVLLQNALCSDEARFRGYVMTDVHCSVDQLEELMYKKPLQQLWPPQIIADLEIEDEDALAKMKVREAEETEAEEQEAGVSEEEEKEGMAVTAEETAEEGDLPTAQEQEQEQDKFEEQRAQLVQYGEERKKLTHLFQRIPADNHRLVAIDATQSAEQMADVLVHMVGQLRHAPTPTVINKAAVRDGEDR